MARFASDNDIRIYRSNGGAACLAEETRVLALEEYVLPDEPECTEDTILFGVIQPAPDRKKEFHPVTAVTAMASLFVLLLVVFSCSWMIHVRCAAAERILHSLTSQNAAFVQLTDDSPGRERILQDETGIAEVGELAAGLLTSCDPYMATLIPAEN